ncbi:dynein intermediate chain 2, ciliary-like [Sycon ciliatum]|uniref:dynein intermediate chain 2, ciliary-like n=1 Tax=Sycon ciliatum TaxID=27933 RepID=UPI0031F6B03A
MSIEKDNLQLIREAVASLAAKDREKENAKLKEAERRAKEEEEAAARREAQLNEVITRVLKATNPRLPSNVTRYNYKEGAYKSIGITEHMVVHWEMPSYLIRADSEEAERQRSRALDYERSGSLTTTTSRRFSHSLDPDEQSDGDEDDDNDDEDDDGEESSTRRAKKEKNADASREGGGAAATADAGGDSKLLIQFNYIDRETQTLDTSFTSTRETMTVPPKRAGYSDSVTQWEIYDRCIEEQARLEAEKKRKAAASARQPAGGAQAQAAAEPEPLPDEPDELEITIKLENLEPSGGSGGKKKKTGGIGGKGGDDDGDAEEPVKEHDCSAISKVAKVMERMVTQNGVRDRIHDMVYFDDPRDGTAGYKKAGTLLHLWSVKGNYGFGIAVKSLCLCPRYSDMFVATYCSVDLIDKVGEGSVCLHTLKNPAFPDHVMDMASGVMSVDVHPKQCHMLCIGMLDGRVAVLDARRPSANAILCESPVLERHTDMVWQVRWQKDDPQRRLNFFSVSSDGFIAQWTVTKDALARRNITPIMQLKDKAKIPIIPEPWMEPEKQLNLARGSCFDFIPTLDNVYLIGTEEGIIHKCSTLYQQNYIRSFQAHNFTIYAVRWNPFQPRVFATCGVDCCVKIWDDERPETPLFVFDLDDPVIDFCWAPYSSTVFVAGTMNGYAHVYDLDIDKYNPLCKQDVIPYSKNRLTKVHFVPSQMLLIAGDDHGNIHTYKLSPNLRRGVRKTSRQSQLRKMNEVIAWVWEPADMASGNKKKNKKGGRGGKGKGKKKAKH